MQNPGVSAGVFCCLAGGGGKAPPRNQSLAIASVRLGYPVTTTPHSATATNAMSIIELLTSQLLDPFRIGLLIALMLTTRQTAAHTGIWLPLALGAVFVAVLIPTTLAAPPADFTTAIVIATGLAANVIILAVILAALSLWSRLTGKSGGTSA